MESKLNHVKIAMKCVCELARQNNLLSVVLLHFSTHGAAAPATGVCITLIKEVWARYRLQGSLGWLLPLDIAHHAQFSNSTYFLMYFTEAEFIRTLFALCAVFSCLAVRVR